MHGLDLEVLLYSLINSAVPLELNTMFISLHNGFHPLLKIRSFIWDFNKKLKIKFQRNGRFYNDGHKVRQPKKYQDPKFQRNDRINNR